MEDLTLITVLVTRPALRALYGGGPTDVTFLDKVKIYFMYLIHIIYFLKIILRDQSHFSSILFVTIVLT